MLPVKTVSATVVGFMVNDVSVFKSDKRLTEKQWRALRQILKKADVLRDVFEFFKENKLTGDESIELVKAVKSEPGFTIKEAYDYWKESEPKKEKIKRLPVEDVIFRSEYLLKTLNNLGPKDLSKTSADTLSEALNEVQKKIKDILVLIRKQ